METSQAFEVSAWMEEVASLRGSGINGNCLESPCSSRSFTVASLRGSGINGNYYIPFPFQKKKMSLPLGEVELMETHLVEIEKLLIPSRSLPLGEVELMETLHRRKLL